MATRHHTPPLRPAIAAAASALEAAAAELRPLIEASPVPPELMPFMPGLARLGANLRAIGEALVELQEGRAA